MNTDNLKEFIAQLKKAQLEDDGAFFSILKASEMVLNMPDASLADILDVSRPTVNRWRSGRNSPHPLMRKTIYARLSKNAKALLKTIEANKSHGGGSGISTPAAPVAARKRD